MHMKLENTRLKPMGIMTNTTFIDLTQTGITMNILENILTNLENELQEH